MKLSDYLNRSVNEDSVNESLILGGIIGLMGVAAAIKGVMDTEFMKSIGTGVGGFFGGIGAMFAKFGPKDDKKKSDDKDTKSKKNTSDDEDGDAPKSKKKDADKDSDDTPKFDKNVMNGLMAMATKANESDKDETRKKKTGAILDLLAASSYDKDGNEIPLEECANKLKDMVGKDGWEAFKKDIDDTYEKHKDSDEWKDALKKAKDNIKESDVEEYVKNTKERAKKTLEQVAKEKEQQEKIDKEIADIKASMEDKDKDELSKLKDKLGSLLKEKKELVEKSIVGTAAPSVAKAVTKDDTDTESDSDDDKTEKDTDVDNETEKETKSEKSADDIENEYKEKSKKLEDEYQEKIDNETDKDKKKELEDEWEKEEAKLSAQKNKQLDAIDDNDEHDTEKDETKKGKYKVKDEEVTDPDTGKKIKVKTYTGPRGGKFYYPDGKPKTPDHKVYVESEQYNSLSNYLYKKFN